jgi:Protein of unknown function (DUF3761)
MKRNTLAPLIAAPLLVLGWNLVGLAADSTATAPTTCKDGTTSSATGRGACSGHGGVQKAAATAAAAAAPAAPAAPAAAPAAAEKSTAPTTTAAKTTAASSKATTTSGNTDPTGATAKCKDGTYSKSKHHSGTCSSHGGVAQWLDGSQ